MISVAENEKERVCQKETKRVWYHKNESHSAVHPGTPTIKISCDLLPGGQEIMEVGHPGN